MIKNDEKTFPKYLVPGMTVYLLLKKTSVIPGTKNEGT